MKLTPRSGFSLFDSEGQSYNQQGGLQNVFNPSLDMYEKDGKLYVELAVPGIDFENVDVHINENNVLEITGRSERKTEIDEDEFYKKEIRYGTFGRKIKLPVHALADKAQAQYEDAVLQIVIPLNIENKVKKKIEIQKKDKKDN